MAPTFDPDDFLVRRRRQGLESPCVNVLAVAVLLLDLDGEFPAVARAVSRRARLVHVRDAADAQALLDRPRGSAENETWFQRAYPYDAWGAWARRLTVDLPYSVARAVGAFRPARPGLPAAKGAGA
jgi:hypothetical protein